MTHDASNGFPGERRMHVGLAVADVERSTRFYRTLLGVEPAKERPGYAKFEPADPSLNLALIEVSGRPPAAHGPAHFGIQVKSTDAVAAATARLAAAGLDTLVEERTACCFAVQDKVWVTDPDGHRWEVFVVLEDAPQFGAAADEAGAEAACCDGSACCTGAAASAAGEACCGP